jgi:type I restriction enzyme M protein
LESVFLVKILQKNDSLDLGLLWQYINQCDDLEEPIDIAKQALTQLQSITEQLNAMIKELIDGEAIAENCWSKSIWHIRSNS